MSRIITLSVFVFAILTITGCTPDPASTEAVQLLPTTVGVEPTPIVLGVISGEPSEAIEKNQPFIDYLAANLEAYGITAGQIKVTPDMNEMGRWMANGEVDIVMDSFFPATIVGEISGASPIAFRLRGKDDKSAVFFARTDSGITTLEGLQGHIIVLEEPDSTSGFLLPIYYLLAASLTPVEKSGPEVDVAPDEVGYIFSGDDDAVVQFVLTGIAPAAAAQDNTFEDFFQNNSEELVEILRTEPIIRDQLIMVRPDIEADVREALIVILTTMPDSEAGQATLEEIETVQFADLSAAREQDRARAQEMFDAIKDEYLP